MSKCLYYYKTGQKYPNNAAEPLQALILLSCKHFRTNFKLSNTEAQQYILFWIEKYNNSEIQRIIKTELHKNIHTPSSCHIVLKSPTSASPQHDAATMFHVSNVHLG
ncbi:hypothetical protein ILYODFUR_016887 [Ilyodon furcidens]|uniref:Uncharacterized protein n=1 Tax=Ilyodon furcidens TaxID=33524 RepID=A0ABV0TJA0_9TELE